MYLVCMLIVHGTYFLFGYKTSLDWFPLSFSLLVFNKPRLKWILPVPDQTCSDHHITWKTAYPLILSKYFRLAAFGDSRIRSVSGNRANIETRLLKKICSCYLADRHFTKMKLYIVSCFFFWKKCRINHLSSWVAIRCGYVGFFMHLPLTSLQLAPRKLDLKLSVITSLNIHLTNGGSDDVS